MAKTKNKKEEAPEKMTEEAIKNMYQNGEPVNLGEYERKVKKESTKRPSIDYVTDGGLPIGRVVIFAGAPSAGKSSLAIQLSNIVSKKILYVDTEATLTTDYIESLDADPYKFSHVIPQTTEKMCDIIRGNIPNYDIIILDSINNSASDEQMEKKAGDKTMANRARVLSEQLPIIIGLLSQHDTTLLVLSQLRDNMDKKNPYSPDKVVPGGNSLHHNSSLTMWLKPATKKKSKSSDQMEKYDTVDGRMVRMHVNKNKVGKPFRTVEMKFTYGKGFTREADIGSSAVRLGILEKAGSWIKYEGDSIVQGVDNLAGLLEDNPELMEELEGKINQLTDR